MVINEKLIAQAGCGEYGLVRRLRSIGLVLVCVFAWACPASAVFAQDNTIDTVIPYSLTYLLAEQDQGNGTWGNGARQLHTTVEVVQALRAADRLGILPSSASVPATADDLQLVSRAIDRAYRAFQTLEPDDLERQTLVASLRLAAGRNLGTLRSTILDQQQADGGWAITMEHRSNIRDTIMVVEALLGYDSIPMDDERILAAINFLKTELRDEALGRSWSYGAGGDSGVMTTARGLLAMRQLSNALGSESAVYDETREILEYLLDQANPNSGEFASPVPVAWVQHDTETYATLLRSYAALRQPGELEQMVSNFLLRTWPSGVANAGVWRSDGVRLPLFGNAEVGNSFPTASVVRALLAVPKANEPSAELPDLWINAFQLVHPHGNGVHTFEVVNFQIADYDDTVDAVNGPPVGVADLPDDFDSNVYVQFYEADPRVSILDTLTGDLQHAQPVGEVVGVAIPLATRVGTTVVPTGEYIPVPPDIFSGTLASERVLGVMIDHNNRIAESDETNNFVVQDMYGQASANSGKDLAIQANTLRVDHTDLSENEVVVLTATVWNLGTESIPVGAEIRVWFQAGSYSPMDGLQIDNLPDPLLGPVFDDSLIGYVDYTLQEELLSQGEGVSVSVDWIPSKSLSQTVCVLVEAIDSINNDSNPHLNNVDQHAFEFSSDGQLMMNQFLGGNGDLLFNLAYEGHCDNENYGFAAYYRGVNGGEWTSIDSGFGTGGSISRCGFRIPSEQAWQIPVGSYQALGEVWFVDPVTGRRDFIDDEIISFTIEQRTRVGAVGIGFQGDTGVDLYPQDMANGIAIFDLKNVAVSVHYQTNGVSFNPNVEFEIHQIVNELDVPFAPPVLGSASALGTGSPLVAVFSLQAASHNLFEDKTYSVVARVSGLPGQSDIVRRYAFRVGDADGYTLFKKVVRHGGVEVVPGPGSGPGVVPARDGETVQVEIKVKRSDAPVGP